MKSKKTDMPTFRQGDVFIQRIANLPGDSKKLARENGRVVLAHGEATGHHHSLVEKNCALFTSDTEPGVTFLEIQEAIAELTHQEHGSISLEPGIYKIVRQREYSPDSIRKVQD
jgi:hypothetical protein